MPVEVGSPESPFGKENGRRKQQKRKPKRTTAKARLFALESENHNENEKEEEDLQFQNTSVRGGLQSSPTLESPSIIVLDSPAPPEEEKEGVWSSAFARASESKESSGNIDMEDSRRADEASETAENVMELPANWRSYPLPASLPDTYGWYQDPETQEFVHSELGLHQSDPPPHWSRGRYYYYNERTGETTWDIPVLPSEESHMTAEQLLQRLSEVRQQHQQEILEVQEKLELQARRADIL